MNGKNTKFEYIFSWVLFGYWCKASERHHARSAINTIQADRRSVVLAMRTHYRHLEEMRQDELDDIDSVMSHISDMLDQPRPSLTTLRCACMVLIASLARLMPPAWCSA